MYINFQQTRVGRSVQTVHTNIFANNRNLHKFATTKSNFDKKLLFRHASSYNVRIRIRIILFWIYKYGTISVTIIYNNKNDSRINPGNRYKDIRRGTSVTIRLPGQRKLINKIDI